MVIPATRTQNAAIVADHAKSQLFSDSLAEDVYHRVVVAKVETMPPYTHTPVFVRSIGCGRRVIKSVGYSANRTPPHVALRVVVVALNKPFYILLTNASNEPEHIPKCMIVAYVTNSLALVIGTETTLLEKNAKIIESMRNKPFVDRGAQILRHRDVETIDDHNIQLDWKSDF